MPFIYRLRIFEIYIDLRSGTEHDFQVVSYFLLTLCVSLTAPAMLQYLQVNIGIRNFDPTTFYDNIRNVWSPLDCLATLPTASQLQRVIIKIIYMYGFGVDEPQIYASEVAVAVFEALPLLSMSGILFVYVCPGDLTDYRNLPLPTLGYEYDEAFHDYEDSEDDEEDDSW
jgi:hypothetical protein